jgi:DNA-binding response OmpR family regulator
VLALNLLIVEDYDHSAIPIQRDLEREYGHKVTIASDLEEAYKQLSEENLMSWWWI